MADIEGTADGRGSGEPGAARVALDTVVDPLVAVDGTRVSYANAATIEAFDLPAERGGETRAEFASRLERS